MQNLQYIIILEQKHVLESKMKLNEVLHVHMKTDHNETCMVDIVVGSTCQVTQVS